MLMTRVLRFTDNLRFYSPLLLSSDLVNLGIRLDSWQNSSVKKINTSPLSAGTLGADKSSTTMTAQERRSSGARADLCPAHAGLERPVLPVFMLEARKYPDKSKGGSHGPKRRHSPRLPSRGPVRSTASAWHTFDGLTEQQAQNRMEAAQALHGDICWYDGVTDQHYEKRPFLQAHAPAADDQHDRPDGLPRKGGMTVPIPESKRRNNDIGNAKCDRISARPVKPVGNAIRAAAKAAGQERLQAYVLQACAERMTREGQPLTIDACRSQIKPP